MYLKLPERRRVYVLGWWITFEKWRNKVNVCLLRCESHGDSNVCVVGGGGGMSGCLTVRLRAQETWGWEWCGYNYSNNENGGYPGCCVIHTHTHTTRLIITVTPVWALRFSSWAVWGKTCETAALAVREWMYTCPAEIPFILCLSGCLCSLSVQMPVSMLKSLFMCACLESHNEVCFFVVTMKSKLTLLVYEILQYLL